MNTIDITGARTHNLKNISLSIPRDRLTVITGLSGSGKSSLAFDTLYAEGQRRYVESLSSYARQFLDLMDKPDVDSITGLSPAISIEQKSTSHNPRSTVGAITAIVSNELTGHRHEVTRLGIGVAHTADILQDILHLSLSHRFRRRILGEKRRCDGINTLVGALSREQGGYQKLKG